MHEQPILEFRADTDACFDAANIDSVVKNGGLVEVVEKEIEE